MKRLSAAAALLVLVTACTSGSTPPTSAPSRATASTGSTPSAAEPRPSATAQSGRGTSKVLTIVLENQGPDAVREQMPFLSSLAQRYGHTDAYLALTHPSLPNYLSMAGGSTAGVEDDGSPREHPIAGRSVFDVALDEGETARTYAEAMTEPCQPYSEGTYAVRHNPWAYFADAASRAHCADHDVPLDELAADLRSGLPTVGLVVPDVCHDGHDCSLATSDAWLRQWVGRIMAGDDYSAGRLAVVVTFDEDEGVGARSGTVLTTVVAPQLRQVVAHQRLSHLSWCRWMTDLVGAEPLHGARDAPSLGRAFGL